MRLITLSLAALLLLIQYPLWLGKGGWLRVWDLDQQVTLARQKNDELLARNAKLNSEVMDLREGTGAIEERARYELGMIRKDEVFIQVIDANTPLPAAVTAAPTTSTAPKEPNAATANTEASPSTKKRQR